MMGYLLIGIFIVTAASVPLSIYVSYLFAVFMVILYFIGLYFMRKRTSRITAIAEKEIIFNLALILHNLNEDTMVPKYKLRCKMGHLGQWVEFHSLREPEELKKRLRMNLIEEENGNEDKEGSDGDENEGLGASDKEISSQWLDGSEL